MEGQQPTNFGSPVGVPGQVNRMINQGTPAMDQRTTNAPGFNPSLIPPANSPMPNKSPMANFSQGLAGQAQPPQAAQPQQQKSLPDKLHSRADLITKALTNHLQALDKLLLGAEPESVAGTQPSGKTENGRQEGTMK